MRRQKNLKNGVLFIFVITVIALFSLPIFNQELQAKTNKASIAKKASLRVGSKKVIKLKNNKKKVKWKIKNKKVAKIVKKSKKSAVIKGRKVGKTKLTAKIGKKTYVCKVTVKKKKNTSDKPANSESNKPTNDTSNGTNDATEQGTAIITESDAAVVAENEKYSYSIEPLLAPFDNLYYVKTDNPDCQSIRFVDKNSIYYDETDEIGYIVPCDERFCDVQYDNKETGLINGGYIFVSEGGDIDGGNLIMQVRTNKNWETCLDTSIVVDCENVKSTARYLVDEYTDASMDFFDKMNAVQSKLNEIAVYPRNLLDDSKVSKGTPYPFLATSPYPELSLNAHYEMYEFSSESLFTKYLYPFDLDSLGFPSVIASAAKIIDPACVVERGVYHYEVDVTYNGATYTYGGAGNGNNSPIYTSDIKGRYLFNGSVNDLLNNITVDSLKEQLLNYGKIADDRQAGLEGILEGEEFAKKIGTGSWLRVGCEPYWVGSSPGTAYTYVMAGFSENSTYEVEDAWVDGRYITKYNQFWQGAKFEDYPRASIILRNQTYINVLGEEKFGDINYSYDANTDTWRAPYTYVGRWWYSLAEVENMPEQFILTREEVEAMDIDGNTDVLPERGLIYDSSAVPGTEFVN